MSGKVLVVDDMPFNLKLIQAKLKKGYYTVYTATNGLEAIEVARRVGPDVIVMDAVMPYMSGFEAIRVLRGEVGTAHIPIIMLSALDAHQDKIMALSVGADDFLRKPVNGKEIVARIKSMIRLKVMYDELRMREKIARSFGIRTTRFDFQDTDGAKVLLVEEDEYLCSKITNKLSENKMQVIKCDDVLGLECGSDTGDYDVIIISLLMRRFDGLRVCATIRNMDRYKHTPILVIVDDGDEYGLETSLDLGAHDAIMSPIEENELLARCRAQVKKRRYHDHLVSHYKQSLMDSIVDDTTHLYNRRYFDGHMRNIVLQKSTVEDGFALMILDLDQFKNINDTFGHLAGNEVLAEVAIRISDSVRAHDLCARYAGDEFVVLMSHVNPSEAKYISDRICKQIKDSPFVIKAADVPINCTASAGVTMLRADDTVETFFQRADTNLYAAKNAGRARAFCE